MRRIDVFTGISCIWEWRTLAVSVKRFVVHQNGQTIDIWNSEILPPLEQGMRDIPFYMTLTVTVCWSAIVGACRSKSVPAAGCAVLVPGEPRFL